MPFSNERGEGFENRIAQVLAKQLGAKLEYTWRAQRRGFFRETLKANRADVVLGVPSAFEMARVTSPLYSSAYVFVTREDRNLDIKSLDDPQLRNLKIGVQLVGDDGSNTPPAHALAKRHIVQNVRGYTLYGDYAKPNPPARIMEAVASGEVDVAIVWGPLAGYFATHENVPLSIQPVSPLADGPALPMAFTICAGVRRGDDQLFNDVEAALEKSRPQIDRILAEYQVPQVDPDKVPVLPREDDDD
jgi:mxaJ protein